MGTFTFFICKQNFDEAKKLSAEHVMDVKGASQASGTLLDAFPRKPDCYDNQLFEVVQSSFPTQGGGWFYFIKSKMSSGFVIGIQGGSKTAGALLEMAPQKTPADDSQLWDFAYVSTDSFGYEWYYTTSKSTGYVIGIQGGSQTAGTLLNVTEPNGSDYQLWLQQSP